MTGRTANDGHGLLLLLYLLFLFSAATTLLSIAKSSLKLSSAVQVVVKEWEKWGRRKAKHTHTHKKEI